MKKVWLVVFFVVLATVAFAHVGSIDEECQAHGFAFGIAKWDCDGSSCQREEQISGYTTDVTGDKQTAYWTASPAVDGVLVKSATNTTVFAGGTSGTVTGWSEMKSHLITHDISHITFCGTNDVPEFGSYGYAFALVGAVGAFFILRKR